MKLTYLSESFFPFPVPEMDSSFASSVGPQTVYPAGFSLDEALQIYWRAQNYQLVAAGNGALSPLTQALSVNGLLPPRNASVGTNSYYEVDGFTPVGPGDLVIGYGMQTVVPGTGTITASGSGHTGTNPDAVFNSPGELVLPGDLRAGPGDPVFGPVVAGAEHFVRGDEYGGADFGWLAFD
jgi:hypothetical protein